MHQDEYSAGAVKFSFWFSEFRKVVALLGSGKTIEEIRMLAEKDNIFSAASQMRNKQIFSTVSTRIRSLPQGLCGAFDKFGLEYQRIITLIAIMLTDWQEEPLIISLFHKGGQICPT